MTARNRSSAHRLLTLAALAVLAVAVATRATPAVAGDDAELDRLRRDLRVMERILDAELSFDTGEGADRSEATGPFVRIGAEHEIEGYYVPDQGAIFLVRVGLPPTRSPAGGVLDIALDTGAPATALVDGGEWRFSRGAARASIEMAIASLRREMERTRDDDARKAIAAKIDELKRVRDALAPDADTDGEARAARRERLEDLARRAEQRRRDERKRLEARLEALALHGDAIRAVAPGESVSVVLAPRSTPWIDPIAVWRGGAGEAHTPRPLIVSVKRSLVTDLKAGRIGREQFLARVRRTRN